MTRMTKDDGVLERNVETLLETGGEAPVLPDAARSRIRAHLIARHGNDAPARSMRTPMFAIGLGLAATVAAALIITRVAGHGGKAEVPAGDVHQLADGSSWIVEPGAKVTVVGTRHVRVEGAALLDVVPGKGTFIVDTVRGRIEVVGTRFLVDASADRTTAAVVRGSVKLASSDGSVLLHAGEQGVAEPGRPPSRGPAPRLSHLVSWAAQARKRDEKDVAPVRHGTLFARDPGVRGGQLGAEFPLPIKKLAIDIVVENQVARVALDQTFHNEQNQVLEGVYRFAIPPDAALQRLAMYVDGKLTESAVVERMRARRIYEELVYRRVDPALLEWAGTGRLSLRVYPLPAHQDKRLLLAYTQSLPKLYSDWTLSVPLPEIDQPVGEVAFDVTVRGCATCEITSTSHPITVARKGEDAMVSYRKTSEKIGDSLVLRVRDARQQTSVAKHTEDGASYLMVRAPANLERKPRDYRPRTWVVLDDVSASRGAMERRAQADLVDAFVRELDEEDKLAVIAFDVAARQKLAPTRVLDVDRKALRASLRDEGDVGATDFAVALDAALELLDGVAPEDAMIVYLGDGVITSGARNLDALRTQLAGKARFVGVGVGDGPDTQTLETLASATSGYATTIDLADDVAWRAFDLIAALHTAQVTGLDGRLVDANGMLVPATLYLRSPQVSDGEELEIVAKLAGAGTPAALELTGTENGAPWQRRIALDAAPTDGGYLPRMWAQRHVAARMLEKHEALVMARCTASTVPCPTESEAREMRDEAIRQEVVALGKQYFLLSRHTSLIVLENDAMYAKYGVRKGSGETWAPYALPATIPVVTTAPTFVPVDVANDAELVRAPMQIFYNYGYEPSIMDRSFATTGMSTGWGTIGHGSGTGQGFGRGGGGGGRSRFDLGIGDVTGAGPATVVTTVQPRDASKDSDANATERKEEELQAGAKGASMDLQQRESRHELAKSARRPSVSTDELSGKIGYKGAGLFGTGDRSRGWIGNAGPLVPQRLTYPSEITFDDLTAFVPALVADDSDAWRERLIAVAGAGTHTIDDAAKAMLSAARKALPAGVYRWGELEIAVDAQRRLGWRRTTDTDLVETASFDGTTWTRRYAELGLDVTRTFAEDDIALALAYLPLWIAEPAHYAKWFDVRAKGPRHVVLSRTVGGKPEVVFVLELDARSRLVAIRDAKDRALLSVTWGDQGPAAATMLGEEVSVGFTGQAIGDAATWAHGLQSAASVAVEMPGRLPAYWDAKLATETVGSPTWRHMQRQRMASLAATNHRPALFAAYEALRTHGGVQLGDLTLASGGIATASTDAQFAPALAPFTGTDAAIARYFTAARTWGTSQKPERLVPGLTTGLVGGLWQLREITALLHSKPTVAVDRLVAMGNRAIRLRIVAAAAMSNRYEIKSADIARAWESVAIGAYKNVARAQAAQAMANRGDLDGAVERVARLVEDLDLRAMPPGIDQLAYQAQGSRRGAAGWQMIWSMWRDRVLAGGSLDHVMSLVGVAAYHRADLLPILARASDLAGSDIDQQAMIARVAIQYGLTAWAQGVIEPLLKTGGTRDLYLLAAQLSEAHGKLGDALVYLESAQAAGGDEAVGISTIRAELARLLQVSGELARQSSGSARANAVTRAMTWAQRWRAIDPGNSEIDRQLGEILLAVGDKQEAWRQLSSVIERDPMSGAGYQTVAEAFERQGRVGEALGYWQQAIVLDQTNPTHRLRKAQALIALGRTAEGDALLTEITKGKWHNIWSGVPYQAQYLLDRGKQNGGR
jgi:tetratricopeptide (TPR) repeat protein